MSLLKYLKEAKASLPNVIEDRSREIHVVIGNEACDLDSAVCAITLGQFLCERQWPTERQPVVPVIYVAREDFCIKTEVVYAFEKFGIRPDDLIFVDEIDLSHLHRLGRLRLTLVDHNVLSGDMSELESSIRRIVDHHKWERPATNESNIHVVLETVGSCATLVAEMILDERRELLNGSTAQLLQSAIIIDTSNFSEKAKKATKKDVDIFAKLEEFHPTVDWTTQFDCLSSAKRDISCLDLSCLLRKDLKTIRTEKMNIAVPSVPISLQDFLKFERLPDELQRFADAKKTELVIVLCMKNGERWVVMHGKSPEHLENAFKALANHDDPFLDLKDASTQYDAGNASLRIAKQGNSSASRKVVLPLLRTFADSHSP